MLCLSASPFWAQSPAFCDDLLSKAKAELKKKDYSKSRDYCEAALPLCPDFTDRFGKVLEEVNTAIEAEKKKAEDNFRLAQVKTKEAEKEAQNARRALEEQKKAVAAQQKALANVVRLTLKDADKKIYTLDYEAALGIIQSAAALQAAPEEVADALLEIAFFLAETKRFARAKSLLDTVAHLMGKTLTPPPGGWEGRAALREAIKTLRPDALDSLDVRYFPTMIPIPGGTDTLGSEEFDDEKPRHAVTIAPFKMAKTETTWWQYNLFCEATGREKPGKPGWGSDGDNPVVNVDWYDAVAYANWLSLRESRDTAIAITGSGGDERYEINLQVNGYRLPTEAEWEYAARGGNLSKGYKYSGSNADVTVAWKVGNSRNRTQLIGKKKPNELGIYDMTGNVYEWCSDWYSPTWYKISPRENPAGPANGTFKIMRGGSWFHDYNGLRVTDREFANPTYRFGYVGFRLCRYADTTKKAPATATTQVTPESPAKSKSTKNDARDPNKNNTYKKFIGF